MIPAQPGFVDAIRVQLVCPAGNAALFRATNQIVVLLLAEQRVKDWGGFTFSRPEEPVYRGYFWHTYPDQPDRASWELDENVRIDVDIRAGTTDDLLLYFVGIRDRVAAIYRDVSQPQAALWITAHPLSILWDSA